MKTKQSTVLAVVVAALVAVTGCTNPFDEDAETPTASGETAEVGIEVSHPDGISGNALTTDAEVSDVYVSIVNSDGVPVNLGSEQEPSTQIFLYKNEETGTWETSQPIVLPEGLYTFVAAATDADGQALYVGNKERTMLAGYRTTVTIATESYVDAATTLTASDFPGDIATTDAFVLLFDTSFDFATDFAEPVQGQDIQSAVLELPTFRAIGFGDVAGGAADLHVRGATPESILWREPGDYTALVGLSVEDQEVEGGEPYIRGTRDDETGAVTPLLDTVSFNDPDYTDSISVGVGEDPSVEWYGLRDALAGWTTVNLAVENVDFAAADEAYQGTWSIQVGAFPEGVDPFAEESVAEPVAYGGTDDEVDGTYWMSMSEANPEGESELPWNPGDSQAAPSGDYDFYVVLQKDDPQVAADSFIAGPFQQSVGAAVPQKVLIDMTGAEYDGPVEL